jgi:hypothetical protein
MRTIVTLEDDVTDALARLEKEGLSANEAINQAVREFVTRRASRPVGSEYVTPAVDLGKNLLGPLDDVTETLALAEGDDAR